MKIDATTIRLVKGAGHDCGLTGEACLFEAYNYLTRQQSTDACPPGVSKILWRFGMSLNDALPDDRRQQLTRFLPSGDDVLAGTETDGKDETRGYMALDWLIRTDLPAWLDLAGLTAEATALRDLRRIADLATAQAAGPLVRDSRDKAHAARDADVAAAGYAAEVAAGYAAVAAAEARAAAVAAAGAAAEAAAVDAAGWDEVGYTAVAAARDAAVARAAAVFAAAAVDAAVAAARDAAVAALAPAVAVLQESAIVLYDTLITGEWPAAA